MTKKEAIKILKSKMDGSVDTSYEWAEAVRMAIEALSAEAEQVTGKLRNPDDSLLTDDTETYKEQKSKLDLISRQDAINEIKNVFDDVLCCNVSVRKGLSEAVRRIEMMPSAEPKQKTGKWKQISPMKIYECPECGQYVMTGDIEAYKFCHGCGKDMR